jgi:transcriptional regulator with XRE-family HTH domain
VNSEQHQIAQRIRRARLAAGITIKDAAITAGVSVTTWRAWERGAKTPLLTRGGKIAQALGVPISSLFLPEGWESVADLALLPETVERVRSGGRPTADELARAVAIEMPEMILAACSRRCPDPDKPRSRRRRTRAEVLAGIEAAKQARRAAASRTRLAEGVEGVSAAES